MAKIDYFPDDIDDIDTWFQTYLDNIDAVLTALGIPLLDAAPTKTAIGTARTAFTKWKNTKALAQSDSQSFRQLLRACTNIMRPFNELIKNKKPPYTVSLGESIGIEGADQVADPSTAKPTGKAFIEGAGVTIKFKAFKLAKATRITCKQAKQTDFHFVVDDTNSPYNDFTPKLDPANPESREYILQYMDIAGKLIGLPSDVLKVTVP